MHQRIRVITVAGLAGALAVAGLQAAGQGARGASKVPADVLMPALPAAAPPVPSRALVDQYCATCHSERMQSGNLVLQNRDMAALAENAEVWEKVLRKLESGAMPPDGARKPAPADVDAFVGSVRASLDYEAAAHPDPGRSGIHRLNRVEYANAIEDLLALEVDSAELLPPDNSGYGFDNIADALTMSPGLLERYMSAAQRIARLAVGDPGLRPEAKEYKLSFFALQDERVSQDLPFGSRGGVAVQHYFPLDGEYTLQVRLQRHAVNLGGAIRGLDEVQRIDVRVDGDLVKSFEIGGGDAEQDGDLRGPYQETEEERFADERLFVKFPARAGMRTVGVTFQRKLWLPEGVGVSRLPVAGYGYSSARKSGVEFGKVEMAVELVEIRGPFNAMRPVSTPSRDKIFVCRPAAPAGEVACAQRIVSTLARQAFRRPVTDADLAPFMALYADGRKIGDFDMGIQWALERLLVDPRFLYRIETDPANLPAGTPYRLSDLELASRLSFFLWSRPPDAELIDVAVKGRLHTPAVLDAQVARMLKDPRSAALVDGFFAQWLSLRALDTVRPDPAAFPEFDDELRASFRRETGLFLQSQLQEDRSVLELLTADYTFVDERLAKHYGMDGIIGPRFRRVTYPDQRRAGLLGQGSILVATSYANRTSPVQRGKWVLMNIIGTPPPEPPANVPPFPEAKPGSEPPTVRARMELHRKNPVCASCHAKMDPLGFALENYDGIGGWRELDGPFPIDASGAMPNGSKFGSVEEFRALLASQEEQFLATVTEKLLTYALGRGVEPEDQPIVRAILQEAKPANYRWSSLVSAVTRSMPFQMRRSL
ncbi:MAG: DUF1592 domain-containing protein [Acidimicrobiia bacterium]|nr:DUF1592 domain-containing protein [Acidimicrobiia bacterium]